MIDKLDLRVPGTVPFTDGFAHVYASQRGDVNRWRKSQYYSSCASFDDCGYPVMLHMQCQMTKKPMHKIELLRTGEMTYSDMVTQVGRIFDCDPEKTGIMRVDLTADVRGVPVDWFKRHTLVKSKQTRREIGKVEPYTMIGKGQAETLYSGVKPNQVRIYDKAAERRMQYGKYLKKFARESCQLPDSFEIEPTSFEAMYGHDVWATITRVERQCAARDIEKLGLSNLASLRTKGDSIDPFEKIIFFDRPHFDPRIEDYGFETWCAGMHLQRRVEDFGVAETMRWLRMQQGKNFDRAKKKFAPFLRLTDNVVGIDSKRLKSLYQASSYRQLLRAA